MTALWIILLFFGGPTITMLVCRAVSRAETEGPGGHGPRDVGECDCRIPEVVHSVKNEGTV